MGMPEMDSYLRLHLSRYVLMAGSEVNMALPIASGQANNKRNRYHAKGIIKEFDSKFYTTTDLEFAALGEAAVFVLGGGGRKASSWLSTKEPEKVTKVEASDDWFGRFLQNEKIVGMFTKDVYKDFQVFCIQNGYGSYSLTMLTRELKKRLPITIKKVRVQNKTMDKYVQI